MKIIILAFTLILSVTLFSQKQASNWFFGDNAGIKFNSGNVVSVTGGQTNSGLDNHTEGSSSISDRTGALLFYSNGENVWNRNHQIMQNGSGLLSYHSSTQSSLIVPQPGSSNLFYLFTTDSWHIDSLKYGFRYSVIDMCLDNQLGGVVSGTKNTLLLDTVAEKLTAVRHSNGIDYWIITHKYFSNKFYAFLLTANGIADTVVSSIGSLHKVNCPSQFPDPTRVAIGQMKASPNGSKLALGTLNNCDNLRELFDFNKSTGAVSNFIDLDLQIDTFGVYGVSFSPDNSKLYLTNTFAIFQYDLTSGNANTIRSSKTQIVKISSSVGGSVSALQLGPDGKIYVARAGKSYLAVINNPNIKGSGCNFQDNAISLNGNICSLGLPNFIDSYDYKNNMVDCSTGLNEHINSLQLKLFPNPTKDIATLEFDNKENIQFTFSLYNIQGQLVKKIDQIKTNKVTIDLESFSRGVYYFNLTNGNQINGTGKLVIE